MTKNNKDAQIAEPKPIEPAPACEKIEELKKKREDLVMRANMEIARIDGAIEALMPYCHHTHPLPVPPPEPGE